MCRSLHRTSSPRALLLQLLLLLLLLRSASLLT
jgi:hypothetical protein